MCCNGRPKSSFIEQSLKNKLKIMLVLHQRVLFCLLVSILFYEYVIAADFRDSEINIEGVKYASVPASVSGINEIDSNGLTRLMQAAISGQLDPLKNYIDGGADVTITTPDGNTALMLAIKGKFYYSTMELIRAKSDLNHRNRFGMTPLLLAIITSHDDIVTGLLDHGANPNIASADGNTALMMATQSGNLRIVEKLINKGANIEAKSHAGDTALMFASASGHVNIVKYLLNKKVSAIITNNRGYTALIFACIRGHGKVIEEIITQYPETLNWRDSLGKSALDHAIYNNHQNAVESLVAKGADLPRSGYWVSSEILERRRLYLKEKMKPPLRS